MPTAIIGSEDKRRKTEPFTALLPDDYGAKEHPI